MLHLTFSAILLTVRTTQESRDKALESMSTRKLDGPELEALARPLFLALATLHSDRDKVSKEVGAFAPGWTSTWRKNGRVRISQNQVDCALGECRKYGDKVDAIKARQGVTIDAIAVRNP